MLDTVIFGAFTVYNLLEVCLSIVLVTSAIHALVFWILIVPGAIYFFGIKDKESTIQDQTISLK